MPLDPSNYEPQFIFKNGHIATIYAGIFREVEGVQQIRERLELEDGDFLDLDWSFAREKSDKVVILLHGLEGHAQRPYILGSAKYFNARGLDCCAVNLRGCSGEPNRLFRSYHSGATEDLNEVVLHILNDKKYQSIFLKGFSLGGNMALKYLGERKVSPFIKGAIAVSVPCNLHDSLLQLLKPQNLLYARRFMKHLLEKLDAKKKAFPELISPSDIKNIKNLKDFDDIYTSKAHGFKDAMDYYKTCSSDQFLKGVKTPTLIINALNDSFLGNRCYPVSEAKKNSKLFLKLPKYGGHVGFPETQNLSYPEKIGYNFLKETF